MPSHLQKLDRAELRRTRESLNMTQGEFASLLGVRRETVNMWEAGRTPLPPFMVFTLAGVVEALKPE